MKNKTINHEMKTFEDKVNQTLQPLYQRFIKYSPEKQQEIIDEFDWHISTVEDETVKNGIEQMRNAFWEARNV